MIDLLVLLFKYPKLHFHMVWCLALTNKNNKQLVISQQTQCLSTSLSLLVETLSPQGTPWSS